jgi:hypothetical protein
MIGQDFHQGLKVVRRSPAFAAAAVVTAGLGIGATAAIFSVLNAVILRPLPFPQPDRLVRISEVTPQGEEFSTSEPNLLDFRQRNRTFESIGAFTSTGLTLTGDGEPQRVDAALITADVFGMLGAVPLLGRGFVHEDEQPDDPRRVVILSEGFWRQRFGGERDRLEHHAQRVLLRDHRRDAGIVPISRPADGVASEVAESRSGARRPSHCGDRAVATRRDAGRREG